MFISSHLPLNISLKCEQGIEFGGNQFINILSEAVNVSTTSAPAAKERAFPCADIIEALLWQKRNIRSQWQEFLSQLNQCQKILRAALKKDRESSLQKYLENLDATKEPDYSLWKAVKKMRQPTTYELQNNEWEKSAEQKVEVLPPI